jgi:hypothetical protein
LYAAKFSASPFLSTFCEEFAGVLNTENLQAGNLGETAGFPKITVTQKNLARAPKKHTPGKKIPLRAFGSPAKF